jgi:hypothetical protein
MHALPACIAPRLRRMQQRLMPQTLSKIQRAAAAHQQQQQQQAAQGMRQPH